MIALLLGACDVREEKIEFKPVRFAEIPGWESDDHAAAFGALLKSCRKIKAPNTACEAALKLGDGMDRETARAFFETHYLPHAVKGGEKGFVTGYYEPEVKGARQRGGEFTVPVYARPGDLITLKPDDERARFNGEITGLRETTDGPKPYYTRGEIDGGALDGRGLELLYLDDPVELFFMQVQGSGRVRLEDGKAVRLGFAAKNGHPYTSIGKRLVEMGEGKPADLTMQGVKAWLRADPERARKLMHQNKSYVFFREIDGDGPIGAQGVALTPERSLAIDTEYHRLGLPVFVAAPDLTAPDGTKFRRLMVAQDVGSAIRGPERGDIYWGSGEAAGDIAGRTRHAAKFTVLLPK
ncbi:MAG: transglycosylase [Alphaproteobacteria bacterium]|nr:transglycosylase [Alphaproteobacteria bacterium]